MRGCNSFAASLPSLQQLLQFQMYSPYIPWHFRTHICHKSTTHVESDQLYQQAKRSEKANAAAISQDLVAQLERNELCKFGCARFISKSKQIAPWTKSIGSCFRISSMRITNWDCLVRDALRVPFGAVVLEGHQQLRGPQNLGYETTSLGGRLAENKSNNCSANVCFYGTWQQRSALHYIQLKNVS